MTATMTRTKFKLLSGRHADYPSLSLPGEKLNPSKVKTYETGEIIESDRDLETIFPNKFRKLTEEESGPVIDIAVRCKEVDKLILGGTWKEGDRTFLERLSEENFVRLNNRFTEAARRVLSDDRSVSILGDDVTSVFSAAYDHELKVFKNTQGKFNVTNKQEPNKPINMSPLAHKEVEPFVTKWVKDK